MAHHDKISQNKIMSLFLEMVGGLTLFQACQKAGYDYKNIVKRIASDEILTHAHARAREEFAHTAVEQMFDIANSEPDVQRARLKCDNVKWYSARVLPKNYGDAILTKMADADGNKITLTIGHAQSIADTPEIGD